MKFVYWRPKAHQLVSADLRPIEKFSRLNGVGVGGPKMGSEEFPFFVFLSFSSFFFVILRFSSLFSFFFACLLSSMLLTF